MCHALGVARQGFYRWLKSPEGLRKKEEIINYHLMWQPARKM